ncbi:MAG: hypothetical protein JW969_01040 [Spirochaetales bacterium]|nr:hypothetical protein [Spirochaetales bacterium]
MEKINPVSGIFSFLYGSKQESPGDNPDSFRVDEKLNRARAVFYSGNHPGNTRVLNIILMAETALKNGNINAASQYAERALTVMEPVKGDSKGIKKFPPKNEKNEDIPAKSEKKNRSTKHIYQDVSHDAGVSFTSPSALTGPESFLAVPAHEGEHVQRRVSDATLKGERVMVLVSYDVRYDPRTGEPFMAGGTTRVIKISGAYKPSVKKGQNVDLYA